MPSIDEWSKFLKANDPKPATPTPIINKPVQPSNNGNIPTPYSMGNNLGSTFTPVPPSQAKTTVPVPPPTTTQTPNNYGVPGYMMKGFTDSANTSAAADIAARTTLANQQKSALDFNYGQNQKYTQDKRNIENFQNSQHLNPFNGFSDYAQGQIARGRSYEDQQAAQQHYMQLGNIDAQLADYGKTVEANKAKTIDDSVNKFWTNVDREAQLTGTYDPYKAARSKMASNSAAWFTASPEDQKRLHDENLGISNDIGGAYDNKTGEYKLPQGVRTLQGKQLDIEQEQNTIKNGQWDKTFELELQKWADSHNLDWAKLDLETKKSLAAMAIDSGQLDVSRDRLKIDQQQADTQSANSAWNMSADNPDNQYKKAEISKIQAEAAQIGKDKPLTTEAAIDLLNKSAFVTEGGTTDVYGVFHKNGKTNVEKKGLIQAIAALPLSGDDKQIEKQMDSLFNYYGISEKDIKAVDDELRAARQSGNR